MSRDRKKPPKENIEALKRSYNILRAHGLFGSLFALKDPASPSTPFPADGYARLVLTRSWSGELVTTIEANVWRRAAPEEWANVLGQALLHLYMNHADPDHKDEAWMRACELVAVDFLRHIVVGQRPESLPWPEVSLPGRDVKDVREAILDGFDPGWHGIAGLGQPSWIGSSSAPALTTRQRQERSDSLAAAIRHSIVSAIASAGEKARGPASAKRNPNSLAERARSWFIANYPLLAALAATFEIVEDDAMCASLDIALAAVDSEMRRIYINPKFAWTYEGMKFVMAHELLHVGLRHEQRRQGRDPYLWNVACDYVINGWLVDMGIGEMPTETLLLDIELGLQHDSAEAIYDRIVRDLRFIRRLNKVRTLRGEGKVDMLGDRPPTWWTGPGVDLDAFYRRTLAEGLDLHLANGRGTLPGDLVDEIRAIQHPPIPWDVRLGQWLDAFFPPLESQRSFARASRRQSSTPDIPRPVWIRPQERLATRTFGVILDTSGSMPPRLLAVALGAIASYAMSREVPLVRVLQCDAGVHDMGYVEPESLLQRVEVRGRGGTVLQPAVTKLQHDERFPKDAPILVITDGACDVLTIAREHAFLMPQGARLPFRTMAPEFHFEQTKA